MQKVVDKVIHLELPCKDLRDVKANKSRQISQRTVKCFCNEYASDVGSSNNLKCFTAYIREDIYCKTSFHGICSQLSSIQERNFYRILLLGAVMNETTMYQSDACSLFHILF